MKLTPLLFTASLAANVALAAVLFFRPAEKPASPSAPVASPPHREGTDRSSSALLAALASGDAAELRAAGVSADIARELALGRAMRGAAERAMAGRASQSQNARWWRSPPPGPLGFEEARKARRELSDALIGAFGHDPFSPDLYGSVDYLPESKRAALRRIAQDYDEMFAQFNARGIQLPSDRERLALLRAERQRDIAALLTPDELAAYELHSSPSAFTVRSLYGDAIDSEEDFRTVFALQKALDEKYPREAFTGRLSPETARARAEAERQMHEQMRAALGEEKYAALRRAADPDLRTVSELAARLNLPSSTTDQVAAARDAYADESQRINTDRSLSPQERRSQLQALAQRAKTELAQTLGTEAADAYSQRSNWLSLLQNGMAYSTSPASMPQGAIAFPNHNVFPVPPAGPTPAGAARPVIINAGAVSVGTGSGFAVPAVIDSVQITSIDVTDAVIVPATPVANPAPSPQPGAAAPAPKQ